LTENFCLVTCGFFGAQARKALRAALIRRKNRREGGLFGKHLASTKDGE
jgi:hypothetical protein